METLDPVDTLDGGHSPKPPEPGTQESHPASSADPETLDPAEPEPPLAVGDLVWAKTKSRLWWPGEVSDPSLAPDDAKRAHGRSGPAVLVAHFGSEGALAWCGRSQLKPFLGPEIHEMAQQSCSKSFIAAVEGALGFMARCLESGLSCSCIPADVRPVIPRGRGQKLNIVNFSPLELLDCLHDVACDATTVGLVECAKLKSWVVAFGRAWCGSLVRYHPRWTLEDLADKIDLDVPAGELVENREEKEEEEEEENWVAGSAIVSELKSRKNRSVTAHAENMDPEKVEVADGKVVTMEKDVNATELPRMKRDRGKRLGVESDSGKMQDESSSAKRERKKSKYLSPPYTDLSGNLIVLSSPRTPEVKTPKKSNEAAGALATDMPKTVRCDNEIVEDEVKKSPLIKFDGTSTVEIFSALLCTAQDLLHLKRNRSAKVAEAFFAVYRSSVFVNGTDFDMYKKHVCEVDKSSSKEAARASSVRKSDRKKKMKDKIDGKIQPGLGLAPGSTVLTEPVKAERKKKQGKGRDDIQTPGKSTSKQVADSSDVRKSMGKRKERDEPNGNNSRPGSAPILTALSRPVNVGKANQGKNREAKETPVALVTDLANSSERRKAGGKKTTKKVEANNKNPVSMETRTLPNDGNSKDGDNVETVANLDNRAFDFLEFARMEMLKDKEIANGAKSVGLDRSQEAKSQRKRRKSNHGARGVTLLDLGHKATNAKHKDNSPRKRRKEAVEHYGNPAALLLSFSPDIALPSKEVLVSTFSKFGLLIDSETELMQDYHSARVVFAKSTDAEAAYNSSEKVGVFGPPFATSRLHYLPPMKVSLPSSSIGVSTPPLSDIRKNLEKMILSLSGASPLKKAGSSDGLKPDTRDSLVGEMQGLLKKVDTMLNGASSSTPS